MLIAPHPDDESLACSVVLQRAAQAGASVRIVYATDGDNNPWPQRAVERKWRLDESDRKNWGRLRRLEARNALSLMGICQDCVQFLALPDQGLTGLLLSDPAGLVELFSKVIAEWNPTHLLVPSLADTHPDHNVLAVVLRLALQNSMSRDPSVSVLSFLVHGNHTGLANRRIEFQSTPGETATKRAAIGCHQTQLKLSRRRFFGYAARPESFGIDASDQPLSCLVRLDLRTQDSLELEIPGSRRSIFQRRQRLLMVGRNSYGDPLTAVFESENGFRRSGRFGALKIETPIDAFSADHELFLKLDRRRIFFDESGWLEVPPAVGLDRPAAPALASVDATAAVATN